MYFNSGFLITEQAVKLFRFDRTTEMGQKCLQQMIKQADSELWIGRKCVVELVNDLLFEKEWYLVEV